MQLYSNNFADRERIPPKYAFSKPDPDQGVTFSENVNPHLIWVDHPVATRSFALICHDPDVPSIADDVNQPEREVPGDLPRVDFYHWVIVDIPHDLLVLEEGVYSDGVVPGGKQVANGPNGTRQGLNDFTNWFAGDEEMGGDYYGYDGPAPPWNDSIVHHYHFTLYALDVARLEVGDDFTGPDALAAMEGHILSTASMHGTYTQNPRLL